MQALAGAVQDIGPAADYARFHDAVAHAQLTQWLAELAPRPELLIDISGPPRAAAVAACAGHSVLRVVEPGPGAAGHGGRAAPHARGGPGGSPPQERQRLRTVAADGTGLDFLADGCADGVIAEDRTLSKRLAAEQIGRAHV